MIVSFRDRETGRIWSGEGSRKLPPWIQATALRKLRQLDEVASLAELRVFRGNRLEPLSGDRLGQFSIRINDQWRICFVWHSGQASEVEIVDYH